MAIYKEEFTAVFDIGKTNKKFFLFDKEFQEVENTYIRIEEKVDEDGFPCEDLDSLESWIQKTFDHYFNHSKYKISRLNFSTYGASLVHLNKKGQRIDPFYNYLKPISSKISESLYQEYGGKINFCQETSSPALNMLNSGIQLLWLKRDNPKKFSEINCSMHFPNYLSYLFTHKELSEYTSIGCHTAMWDYQNNRYHDWVIDEGINTLLAPLTSASHCIPIRYNGKLINVGPGIHDSSAALIPYLQGENDGFILMSTGTWSICMNFFNNDAITQQELEKDSLNFLSTNGSKIKATRLFLGAIFKEKANQLEAFFNLQEGAYKKTAFDFNAYLLASNDDQNYFDLSGLNAGLFGQKCPSSDLMDSFDSFEEGYHKLIYELVTLQIESLLIAVGTSKVSKIYIDGGFTSNQVFLQTLLHRLPQFKLFTTDFSLGTALGAAMVMQRNIPYTDFLKSNYKVKEVKSVSLPVD